MIAFRIAVLTAAAALLAAPAGAQTFGGGTKTQALPAPAVVRMPMTFGGTGAGYNALDRPVASGEFTTHVRSVGGRAAEQQHVLQERFAEEQAFIAKRGLGKPVILRKARY